MRSRRRGGARPKIEEPTAADEEPAAEEELAAEEPTQIEELDAG